MESSRLLEQLSQNWQKLPLSTMSKLASLLLVIYCAHLISTVIWQFVPSDDSYGSIKPTQMNSTSSSAQRASLVDVGPLVALNVFGEENKKAPPPKPVVQTKTAPKTRLNLTLAGLVADTESNVSKNSVAIIESAGKQNTYAIGDTVDGTQARVDQIFIDRVILLVSGRYETLMLDGIEYSTDVPDSADDMKDGTDAAIEAQTVSQERGPRVPSRPPARMDKRADIELSRSLRDQRDQLFDDPKKLLDYIRIRPYRQKGELLGYRLTPGKDPSLFQRVGLKHNDLATSINGYDLTDLQQALSVMKELKTMTEANITVMRDDSPVEIILAL